MWGENENDPDTAEATIEGLALPSPHLLFFIIKTLEIAG
jgi:hypothetical protein